MKLKSFKDSVEKIFIEVRSILADKYPALKCCYFEFSIEDDLLLCINEKTLKLSRLYRFNPFYLEHTDHHKIYSVIKDMFHAIVNDILDAFFRKHKPEYSYHPIPVSPNYEYKIPKKNNEQKEFKKIKDYGIF